MGCEKCNIKLRPREECLYCWKVKKEQPTINPVYRYVRNYTFTAGSTTNISWNTTSDWDDEDWYITTTGYTR